MKHFLEPEEVDYPLTTKEGWAAFVAETVAPPVVLPPAALQRLPEPSGRSTTGHGRTTTPSW